MPNIKSAAKRVKISQKQHDLNRTQKTLLKTNYKKFNAAVAEGNKEAAEAAYKVAVKTADKAVAKGLVHKNNAANKKSAFTKTLNSME